MATTAARFRPTTETFSPGSTTLPQRYFTSAELFDEEQAKIFARSWVLVGHESQVAAAGEYFLAKVTGESLIVTRDGAGKLHAFDNVCRHRGSRLCEDANGRQRAIRCPYHAWTYALDGRLTGAPHMQEVAGFDVADYSLGEARIESWEGFLFINLDERAAPLPEVFAPLRDKFSHWNLPALRSFRRISYDVAANWKLIFQNYSECYHCPGVHPMLAQVSPSDSAENDLTEGPFLGGFMGLTQGASLTMSGGACARPVGDVAAGDHARVFYYSIFPNMLLSLHPDYVMVHQIWPQSPERSRVLCDWYFHPDAAADPDFRPEDAVEFWDITNKQDWHVCELSQQGIGSRAYRPGPYSARESIPAAWDREYLRRLS